MTTLSLREAAKAAGTSRSTLLRRIQAGRLSAPRLDDGVYAIEREELLRVCPPRSEEARSSGRTADIISLLQEPDARTLVLRLEQELAVLKAALDAERAKLEDLRQDRDRWHAQAERLALAIPPSVARVSTPLLAHDKPKSGRWLKIDGRR